MTDALVNWEAAGDILNSGGDIEGSVTVGAGSPATLPPSFNGGNWADNPSARPASRGSRWPD
jgi:hypothetical protein